MTRDKHRTAPGIKILTVSVYVALILLALPVFWQVRNFGFVNYDDSDYVYRNYNVTNGLTLDGFVWAFTSGYASNWHPLTWLTHMLDCQLFGTKPGPMHMVNLLFHIVNTLLLFALLKRLTGDLWPGAFVAAAFALHPMHVESVAWIAERKDLLSAFFLLLTLMAYAGYSKRPSVFRYLLSLVLFAFGLMSKPMLVTLPFLLLLLDYWPFGRLDNKRVAEKVPFFALSVASSIVTFIVQRTSGAVVGTNVLPLGDRIANAFISYFRYIAKLFWPGDLAAYYPFASGNHSPWLAAICAASLIGISILIIRLGGSRKYLPVGWFWFVGTLVPVIGFVQVGGQAFADRYTYIPYIGLLIVIAWGLPELLSKWPYRKPVLVILATLSLAAMGLISHRQAMYWSDTVTLFSHAIDVTKNNDVAHNNRGVAYNDLGRGNEAIADIKEALRITPNYAEALSNLGNAYSNFGHSDEAVEAYRRALKLKPDNAAVHYNLAIELAGRGQYDQAIEHYRMALKFMPNWAVCMNNLAYLIAVNPGVKGRDVNEAIRLAEGACRAAAYRDPVFVDTLAAAYAAAGRFQEAIAMANRALTLAADQPSLKAAIQQHLALYKQGKPLLESAPRPVPNPVKP